MFKGNSQKSFILLFFLTTIVFAFWACKKNSNNDDNSHNSSILFYSGFENNGLFSLVGWEVPELQTSFICGSKDVPPTGGKLSLELIDNDGEFPGCLTASIPLDTGIYKVKLSFWGKTFPWESSVWIYHIKMDSTERIKYALVDDTIWKQYTIHDTLIAKRGDSLKIKLFFASLYRRSSVVFYDEVKLERLY